jgi:hypothetical protein
MRISHLKLQYDEFKKKMDYTNFIKDSNQGNKNAIKLREFIQTTSAGYRKQVTQFVVKVAQKNNIFQAKYRDDIQNLSTLLLYRLLYAVYFVMKNNRLTKMLLSKFRKIYGIPIIDSLLDSKEVK